MGRAFLAGAAGAALLAFAGSANAAVFFDFGINLEDTNGPATMNIDPAADAGDDNVVLGLTKSAPFTQVIVTALPTELIKASNFSAGVVWIVPVDGGFTHLRFELAPGFSFKSFEVDMQEAYAPKLDRDGNPELDKDGNPKLERVNYDFTLTANDGTDTFSHLFTSVNHGFYSAYGDDAPEDTYLKYVEFTSNIPISAVGQIRIDGIRADVIEEPPPGVPEPATWAMMIMGFGAAGSMIRRRRTVRA